MSDSAAKPRLLDLFCGVGGAAMGYHRAGFEVVGVDIKPQLRYPFVFFQADATAMRQDVLNGCWHESSAHSELPGRLAACLGHFDAIHASPPCQRYSDLARRNGNAHEHPDLIGPVRELLEAAGLPYVIENVEGAPLIEPVTICGTALDLNVDGYRLRRHRRFEANFPIVGTDCACAGDTRPVIDVSGGGPGTAPRLDGGGGRTYKGTADQVRELMGMPWATKAECNEAIPPAYTEFIGAQLLAHVRQAVAA